MGKYCCVPLCTSDSSKCYDKKLSFHTFPGDVQMQKAWLRNIRRDEGKNFRVGVFTYVCSLHFLASDFIFAPSGNRNILKKNAMPTIFAWTDPCLPNTKASATESRKALKTEDNKSALENLCTSAPTMDHTYFSNTVTSANSQKQKEDFEKGLPEYNPLIVLADIALERERKHEIEIFST